MGGNEKEFNHRYKLWFQHVFYFAYNIIRVGNLPENI